MALFAIQLVRVVLSGLAKQTDALRVAIGMELAIGIHQMFNVILRSFYPVLLKTLSWLGHRTNNNFGACRNEVVLR